MPLNRTIPAIQALIFDFDGTLVDASEPICRSFNLALERFGLPQLDDEAIKRLIGQPLRDMFPAVAPHLSPADIERLIDYYREAFMPIACALSRPMPGLRAMLTHFSPHLKMAIATSRISDGAFRILDAMHIRSAFPVVIGLQDVNNAKPHPEPVLKALAALDVSPEHAVMVGDVPADMLAGKAAGAWAIGFPSKHYPAADLKAAGADAMITSLADLIDLIPLDVNVPSTP